MGEIVDALDAHRRAGEIRAFGVSNWTLPRIDEANAYAAQRGVAGIACNSPHLSLAVQNEPPWAGCLSATDAESRAWHARTGHAAARVVRAGGRLVRGRGARASTTTPPTASAAPAPSSSGDANAVALAWVLAQPFPTVAIVGPHSLEHLHASLEALDVELSADEVRWLNLEA